jgi:hypothetical protein
MLDAVRARPRGRGLWPFGRHAVTLAAAGVAAALLAAVVFFLTDAGNVGSRAKDTFWGPDAGESGGAPQPVMLAGVVTRVRPDGALEVQTSGGTRVVEVPQEAHITGDADRPERIRPGQKVDVGGDELPDGTVRAATVAVGAPPPASPAPSTSPTAPLTSTPSATATPETGTPQPSPSPADTATATGTELPTATPTATEQPTTATPTEAESPSPSPEPTETATPTELGPVPTATP